MLNIKKFLLAIGLVPKDTTEINSQGELEVLNTDGKLRYCNGSSVSPVVTESHSATLTNKTIDANGTGNSISNLETADLADGVLNIDLIDALIENPASDTQIPSALAVKTYVDTQVGGKDEADEIIVDPAVAGATNVQSALTNINTAINDHIGDNTDAHDASAISVSPSGNLGADDVQEALEELQTDIDTRATSTALTNHTGATTGAHAASAISVSPTIGSESDVQSVLEAHQAHVDASTSTLGNIIHGLEIDSSVVGTTDAQELTNKTLTGASIEEPIRSDVKQDTLAALTTYAASATNGQIVFATDEKKMFQVVDGELVSIGGAGIVKLTAGENISANDQVYISTGTGNDSARTAGRIYKADASNDDRADVLGFAPKAITSGAIGEVQTSGNLTGLSGLTAGKIYYTSASTPGLITATPPSADGQWIVPSALAVSSSEIVINPVASASSIYVVDSDTSFTIANAQLSPANITGLLFDPIVTQSFSLDYVIYRQTDTASSALAQVGQLRGVYNTQASTWFMSDDFSGQNAAVTFSIQPSGQIQYSSSNIAGANYVGSLKYNIKKTFGV